MHFFTFSVNVSLIIWSDFWLYIYIIMNSQTVTLQADDFFRIICYQIEIIEAQIKNNLCSNAVIP